MVSGICSLVLMFGSPEYVPAFGQYPASDPDFASGASGVAGAAGAFFPAGQTRGLLQAEATEAPHSGEPEVSAPSALLMEAKTGTVIYEKNADEPRNPASVTKIMTLILIFDALASGQIRLEDQVVTSAYAKSMGGSQVFLEEGEVQSVETLIKCIVIASGNDASVAMAEYVSGDEGTFVRKMNERAAGLGMEHTRFVDCCGLTTDPEHVTTARDIALMSRELLTRYPQITAYSTIWMENITHVTKQGSKEFGLSNTNKLLKMAANFRVTGLKTGSTSIAKYCLAATAEKDGIELIAAIMAAPDYKTRFRDAMTLLNYGYGNCRMYRDESIPALEPVLVKGGVKDTVKTEYRGEFTYLALHGEDFSKISRELIVDQSLQAPVNKGDVLGYLIYKLGEEELGRVAIEASETVEKAGFADYWRKVLKHCFIA